MTPDELWTRIRRPFLLPQKLHHCHIDDWELYDADRAGCLKCGRLHKCSPTTCRLTNNEGHQVCEVTGYCVKNLVFADDEFVSTVSLVPTQYIAVRRSVEGEQVQSWVREALSSEGSRRSLAQERRKRELKKAAIFTRLAKHYKATKTPVNIIAMASTTQLALHSTRVPTLLEDPDLEILIEFCVETITLFMHRFLPAMPVIMPAVRVHGFVIGVLYLMRSGVRMCDSVEILPRTEALRGALPLESQLWTLFRLHNKVITEAENIIKSTLKGLTRRQLQDLGFA